MEEALRYIVYLLIVYGLIKGIYQSIRFKKTDYSFWCIILLLGIDIWFSRMFLIANKLYDFMSFVIIILVICYYLFSNKKEISPWLKRANLCLLSFSFMWFGTLSIIAYSQESITIKTPLRGYFTGRIDTIYFTFHGSSFERSFNLTNYAIGKQVGDYEVLLQIKPISENIVKLESIDLNYIKRNTY